MFLIQLIFVFLTFFKNGINGQPEIITPCSSKCIPFRNCTSAIRSWLELNISPITCFFDEETGKIPYVCCPEEDPQECQLPVKFDLINTVFKISNGEEADPADFPYMVGLSWDIPFEKFFACGGTLIHKLYVLTAAHCSFNHGKYLPLRYAIVGGGNIKNSSKIIGINSVSQHPKYNSKQKYHDIAILRLAEEVNNQPACIPNENYILPDETEVIAAGYGRTHFYSDISEKLLQADFLIYNQTNCSKYYGDLIESQLCALSNQILLPNRKIPVRSDTCRGDSGGPLTKKNTLMVIGIVSFGYPCESDMPGVYTRVSSYYEWIQSKISP